MCDPPTARLRGALRRKEQVLEGKCSFSAIQLPILNKTNISPRHLRLCAGTRDLTSLPFFFEMSIHSISAESMILILEYLRAIDLASCREVDKTVFEKGKIVRAIQFHFQYTFPLSGGGSKTNSLLEYRCDVLYVREVKSLLATLSSAQPTKGFWISATWVANAKKYFEALVLPDCGNVGKSRKQARVRQRRGTLAPIKRRS